MNQIQDLVNGIQRGDTRNIARGITIVENELPGNEELLSGLTPSAKVPLIGITGPPGAGKSTLINALINQMILANPLCKIAILAIDPTSAFNFGSILGDRLRMSEHFNNDSVYIRSAATRGSLGGLSAKTIEITELLKSSDFNYVIVETVGVGQSEVEIAGLADTTIVVMVPEAGDEIQALKSGIMEIADIFVVNKADRDGASTFAKNLTTLAHSHSSPEWNIPVVKTSASKNEGIQELFSQIQKHSNIKLNKRKPKLLLSKAEKLIAGHRMKRVDHKKLSDELLNASDKPDFNLYRFVFEFIRANNL